MTRKSLIFFGIALAISSIFQASSALAYVPPSHFIIKTLAAKHAGPKGIRLRSQVTKIENGKPSDVRFKALTVYNAETQILRSWALDDAGQKLYQLERKANTFTVPDALMFLSSVPDLTRTLTDAGVPIRSESDLLALPDEEQRRNAEVTYFKRWKNVPAWLIGRPIKTEPQLWIEKDSFLPVRVLIQHEVQFDSYRFYRGFPYPRMISLIDSDETPVLQEEMLEFTTASSLPEFKGSAPFPASGFTEIGNASPSAQKTLIEQFYKFVR
ncbi:MAG: hypothetical protein A2428_04480 [Bdellovibrionales bacterium RIFOXYC1_FULL_54_43]|nr:MAG: hypothetical protein A2428_04480 [Bdellovibrionales bacterium RIFOXYC1_FULL_54_43]OFZ83591.1 MAG: hypothetical protein A2603_00460 [Bdellovibrionales bacterium RIFOXYD1_FULL_55_31]